MADDDVTHADGDVSGGGDDVEERSLRGPRGGYDSASYPPVDEQYESADSAHDQSETTFSSEQKTRSANDEPRTSKVRSVFSWGPIHKNVFGKILSLSYVYPKL